jgi:L-fuconolactonase
MLFPIIDAHQHFLKYDPQRDQWITEDMKVLHKDYLPADIEPVFKQNHISGSVAVQADPSENENQFLLGLAARYPFIRGVVGWIDLQSPRLEERLEYYQQFPLMKGFRNILQSEEQRDSMLKPGFQQGISLLNKYGFSYDLLILPDQIGYAEKLAAAFPEQRFIIDHMAKPYIKHGMIAEWKMAIKKFASFQHVYCKISGLVTEADWEFWEIEDFRPYVDVVLETFGTKRILFGSDWPVCLLAGDYDDVKQIAEDYFYSFSIAEQTDFFGANAMNFYHLT